MLNSLEELCIMREATVNSFARVPNPDGGAYIYIYIYNLCYVCFLGGGGLPSDSKCFSINKRNINFLQYS